MGIVSVDDTGNDLGQWGAMVGDNICLRSGAIMDHENRIAHVAGQIDTYLSDVRSNCCSAHTQWVILDDLAVDKNIAEAHCYHFLNIYKILSRGKRWKSYIYNPYIMVSTTPALHHTVIIW